MQNREVPVADDEVESAASVLASEFGWSSFVDDDIMQQQSAIRKEEAEKIPFVGDKARVFYDSLLFIIWLHCS